MNITYDLKQYSIINETFPISLRFNSTVINLSGVRSDWADFRFGNGTCANVSKSYLHNIVYANSSESRMIIYVDAGDIINNTKFQLAVFYNNSQVTHLEPRETDIDLGNGRYSNTRWFSNDKSIDNDSTTYSVFNNTGYEQKTYGFASLLENGYYGKNKYTGDNNATYYQFIDHTGGINSADGIMGFMRFKLFNVKTNNKYVLMSFKNSTDVAKTNIMELYIQ
jgi:hypothetical protein